MTIASPGFSIPGSICQDSGITEHMGGTRATERLLKMAGVTPGQRVIDMGCGTGYTACTMAKRGVHVIAVDIDPGMLARTKARATRSGMAEKVCLVQADLHYLPFKEGSFDVALAESVLAFCDADRVSREAFQILKPGGMLGINELTYLKAPDLALKAVLRLTMRVSLRLEREWKTSLLKAGFTEVVGRISKMSLPGQFLSHLKIDGPVAYTRALAKGLLNPAAIRALIKPKTMGAIMKYRSYVGYGLYTGKKP